jgi:hypothetical protein
VPTTHRLGHTRVVRVEAVHRDAEHRFSKDTVAAIELVEGHGVAGDAHYGVTVQHLSRVARSPASRISARCT